MRTVWTMGFAGAAALSFCFPDFMVFRFGEGGRRLSGEPGSGDYFLVESPGKDGWQHRWQGLDARR